MRAAKFPIVDCETADSGAGGRDTHTGRGIRWMKLQRFLRHPSSTDLYFWSGATEPRSFGRGAWKHRKLGDEGGEVFFNFGLWGGGRWGGGGRDTPAGRGGSGRGSCEDFYPTRHQLALIFLLGTTEPRSAGRGTETHRKVGNEGGEVSNCGFRNGGRRGGGPRYTHRKRGARWRKLQRFLFRPSSIGLYFFDRRDGAAIVGAGDREA